MKCQNHFIKCLELKNFKNGKFTDMVYPFLKNILLKIKSKSRGKKQKKER